MQACLYGSNCSIEPNGAVQGISLECTCEPAPISARRNRAVFKLRHRADTGDDQDQIHLLCILEQALDVHGQSPS
jgi:hypothetical protein